ncbi:hypothetical protein [Desulfosporosinus lacus]|uniref:site-specific DNA-methyltransferase (cytosine-N(4)-specific) n=1 Tax=Desulfosporosinus lacus DSM 15449 TaxID=1121420 RepID=A0A1M5V0N4_9FIRM|nr:hypothetical protein [Desulfosporosinus lacus]SHH68801.1 Methyltransferase domain-containing protein [Desulfosporosinus lacus DSM 15449]
MSNIKLAEKFNNLTLESEDHWDYRGTNNSERDYVHGFCTYPAMMVPKMQREMLQVCLAEMSIPHPQLLDPFAGSGTILVEGMLQGLDVVGIDINPLAVLLCKVKTTLINVKMLEQHAAQLITNIEQVNNVTYHQFKGIEKWFTAQAICDLSKIRTAITKDENLEIRRFFWAAFCEVVRMVSNSRDCTYKLHIKDAEDINTYNKDAISLFKETLTFNSIKHNEFYSVLKRRGYIRRDGVSYKGSVKIILGDCIAYLQHTKKKFDLIFTSPPYGDNHTTVSYGQYSVIPLRWINSNDIDESIDEKLLNTLYEIDNISLGGMSSNKYVTRNKKNIVKKSETLKEQINTITEIAPKQVNKLISFYSDFDRFLATISKKMKPASVSVWTLGNRKVAKQEIYMNKIMVELGLRYNLSLLTNFTRKILNKRMPKINAYTGDEKDIQGTMTREHILIFKRSDIADE